MINVSIIASETEIIMIVVHSVYIARAICYSPINAQIVISLGVAHCPVLSNLKHSQLDIMAHNHSLIARYTRY